MRKHYTEAQRVELVALVTSGQAGLREAAARLGVAESTAYYWVTRARRRRLQLASPRPSKPDARPLSGPTFARLIRATDASNSIGVRVGGVVLEVRAGFDPMLLRAVIAALMEVAP